jgi:hypothetical protein
MEKMFTRLVAWYLVLAICVMGMVPRVYAGMVSSEILTSHQADRVTDLAKIQKVMERSQGWWKWVRGFGSAPSHRNIRWSLVLCYRVQGYCNKVKRYFKAIK